MEYAESLTGPRKAALLLMILGEDFTTKVFKHLNESEIMKIGSHMAQIKNVDRESVTSVMEEFKQNIQGKEGLGVSGRNFLERTVSKAFDSRKADDLLGDLLTDRSVGSF